MESSKPRFYGTIGQLTSMRARRIAVVEGDLAGIVRMLREQRDAYLDELLRDYPGAVVGPCIEGKRQSSYRIGIYILPERKKEPR